MPRPRKAQGIEAAVDRALADVKERLVAELSTAVQQGMSALLGTGAPKALAGKKRGRGRGKRKMSPAARKRMSEARKKWWAARKKGKGSAKAEAPPG